MIKGKDKNMVLPQGLYGITAEKFSNGRTNAEVVEKMIEGGIKTITFL